VEVWKQEVVEIWNHEPTKLWNHEPTKSCVRTPRNSGVMDESSEIRKKPSQRRYLKKSGFDVSTSGRLVNV
jgi:exopolysaccharide biosynthesis protein